MNKRRKLLSWKNLGKKILLLSLLTVGITMQTDTMAKTYQNKKVSQESVALAEIKSGMEQSAEPMAATVLDAAPYPQINYSYSTSVSEGTIRYLSQNPLSGYFHTEYWGKWAGQAKTECLTSCISMALSYVGVNKTPENILDYGEGKTYKDGKWGGTTLVTKPFAQTILNYMNGKGKYSPVMIKLVNGYSSRSHYVMIVAKKDAANYLVLDPYNDQVWNIAVEILASGIKVTYQRSGKTYTDIITDTYQYYNGAATDIPQTKPSESTKKPSSETPSKGNDSSDSSKGSVSQAAPLEAGAKIRNKKTNAFYRVVEIDGEKTLKYLHPINARQTSLVIPGKVKIKGDYYKVTAIRAKACRQNPLLKTVIIGKNVSYIGKKAFYRCSSLGDLTIKTKKLKQKNIGQQAFSGIASSAILRIPERRWDKYWKMLHKKGAGSGCRGICF